MTNKNPPTPPKTSNRQQARDLSARLETVEANLKNFEEGVPQFMFATDRAIGVLQNQQSHATEIQNAIVAIIGQDQVIDKIRELRIVDETRKAEDRRGRVLKALEEGKIEPEETVRPVVRDEKAPGPDGKPSVIDEGSIISLVEFNPEGQEVPYSFACVPLAKLSKEKYQEQLAGQKVGFEWEIEFDNENGQPSGQKGKAVLTGIYKRLKKPEAPPALAVVPEALPEAPALPDVNTAAGEDPSLLDPSVAAPAIEATPVAQA